MRLTSRSATRGFTLVELMVVVSIVGVLAAVAIFSVRRSIASARTAEAKNTVGDIARAAVAAYEGQRTAASVLFDKPATKSSMNSLCASATAVPAAVPAAHKYQPSTVNGVDYNTGDDATGWKCLRFSDSKPSYYQFAYGAGNAGGATGYIYGSAGGTSVGFEAIAVGDLNGNGVYANFGRGADLRNRQLTLSTQVYVSNEFE